MLFTSSIGRPAASSFRRLGQNLSKSLRPQSMDEKVLFWSGFMYVPSAVLTPLMTRWQLQHTQTPQYEQDLMVRSEVVRQVIGAVSHFVGFFGGMALFGLKGQKSAKPRTMQKLAGSVLGATAGYAFLRPLLLNSYMARWIEQHHKKEHPSFVKSAPPLPTYSPQAAMAGYTARHFLPAPMQETLRRGQQWSA